jgi:hypothetical protein
VHARGLWRHFGQAQQLLLGETSADNAHVIQHVLVARRDPECAAQLPVRGIEVGIPDVCSRDQHIGADIVRMLREKVLTQRQRTGRIACQKGSSGLGEARVRQRPLCRCLSLYDERRPGPHDRQNRKSTADRLATTLNPQFPIPNQSAIRNPQLRDCQGCSSMIRRNSCA